MKLVHRFSLATLSAAALSLLAAGSAQAESTYGYNAAGASGASATARVKIEVKVPMLILLRVGKSGVWGPTVGATKDATEVVSLQAALNPGIPGGILASAVTTNGDGSSLASGWDGTAPVMGVTSTPATIQAWAWTNAVGGGKLTGAIDTAFANGLAASDVTVLSTPVSGGGLAHPGGDTSNATMATGTSFTRNTVVSSDWAYTVTPAALTAMNPGTDFQIVKYTALSL